MQDKRGPLAAENRPYQRVDILKKAGGSNVEIDYSVPSCDILFAHPKKIVHDINAPFQLIYANLMGPMSPAAHIGGFGHVGKEGGIIDQRQRGRSRHV